MKQRSNQGNASVAWFKLAELITRREREKALSVYRLLAHSLERKAYALQLEGDILWSLDDKAALEKYRQAAFLYHKEKQWIDAAAVCEHLYTMNDHDLEVVTSLIRYYALLQWTDHFVERLTSLITLVEKNIAQEHNIVDALKHVLEDVSVQEEPQMRAWISCNIQNLLNKISDDLSYRLLALLD